MKAHLNNWFVFSGDVDFYPNGYDPIPPGCDSVSCAHFRAVEYYAESVYPGNEANFPAKKCDSILGLKLCEGETYPMGYATPETLRGTFFLETSSESPFGLNAKKNFEPVCQKAKIATL